MPHLFVNRHRLHDLTNAHPELGNHFRWETINADPLQDRWLAVHDRQCALLSATMRPMLTLAHGLFSSARCSTSWSRVMTCAKCGTTGVPGNLRRPTKLLEFIAAISYLVGTLLFTVGSIFFLSALGWIVAGAWCFVIGSLLFVIGACVNVLQIVQARSLITLQLMNLTAICFVVGSVLFLVASIPYLWTIENAAERETLFSYMAWEYEIGSVLFLLGGVYNYSRAYLLMRDEIQQRTQQKAPATGFD